MNHQEKALMTLLGRGLFGLKLPLEWNIDPEALYTEACVQTVIGISWDALTCQEQAALPEDLRTRWRNHYLRNVAGSLRLREEQSRILHQLDLYEIPCAILKGSTVACNYPQPLLRTMGDIDILVHPCHQQKVVELLQPDGYGAVLEAHHPYHFTISKGKISVEIHRQPNGIQIVADPMVANKLNTYFESAMEHTELENGIPTLNTEYQAVVLLLHKLEHFLYGGLGLRQLCDWACFVHMRLSTEEFTRIRPVLEDFGLMEFAGIITRSCCDWLHLPPESADWCLSYDAGLAQEVLEQILSSGNFGKKNSRYGQRIFEDYASANRISSAFKVAAASSRRHWPPCEKYPVLLPVGLCINVARYWKLRRQGKRPDLHPVQLFRESESRQRLYKSLKPFQHVPKRSDP